MNIREDVLIRIMRVVGAVERYVAILCHAASTSAHALAMRVYAELAKFESTLVAIVAR